MDEKGLRDLHLEGIDSVTVTIPLDAFEDLWIDLPDSTPQEVVIRALEELSINIGADIPGLDN